MGPAAWLRLKINDVLPEVVAHVALNLQPMIYLRGVLTEGVVCVFAERVIEELADGVFEGSLPKDVARIVAGGVIEGACEGLLPKNVA